MNDVVVSTACPSCGAPLDFTQGTNAIRCDHCSTNLLVTGRKRVLAYWVRPAITAGPAVARAKLGLGDAAAGVRIGETRLVFVPYYRLVGHEFRWERPRPAPTPVRGAIESSLIDTAARHAAGNDVVGMIAWARTAWHTVLSAGVSGVPGTTLGAPMISVSDPALHAADTDEALAFRDRYIDRSFLASTLPGLGVDSLGVRASVLRLALFRRPDLEALGRVVAIDVASDVALEIGMRPLDPRVIVHRAVIGRMLSLIYFPFWCVTIERGDRSQVAIVDAVADSVVTPDAPASLLARLDRAPTDEPDVVGFRPLTCPNCGWDLPLAREDVIFSCASCARAWLVEGEDLLHVPARVARVSGHASAARYLPFWVLDCAPGGPAPRYFSPAFRVRHLKLLSDLARRLSCVAREWDTDGGPTPELHGCYYDLEDAMLLARFTENGLAAGLARAEPASLSPTAATLTWFPFATTNREVCDPFTGMALPQNALV